MVKVIATVVLVAAAAGGCGSMAPAGNPAPSAPHTATPGAVPAPATRASLPHYRCDHGIDFTVHFVDNTALLDAGPRGNDVLLRDAGGATPQQTVYSNPRVRAEFGLGATGREAILRYVATPQVAHCTQG